MNDFYGNNREQDEGFYAKSQQDIVQDSPAPDNNVYSQSYNAQGYQYQSPQNNAGTVYNAPSPKKPRRTYGFGTVILSALLAAFIGAGSAFGVLIGRSLFTDKSTAENGTSISSITGMGGSKININIDEQASSIAEAVAKKCSQSVVGIRTLTSVRSFFGGSQEEQGEGSGVVYTADGYIITNYHVIEGVVETGNGKIEVYVGDLNGKSYSATVVGYHISSDLAVLKVEASGLTPIEFSDSDELSVGQYAITIGAPGGLEFMGSVTYGIISGLNRVVSTSQSVPLIQTDAAINPGNSGGALLNAEGKLIGINSSKIVSEEFEGMGFAIPSNTVKERVEKIISKKDADEPYIGISVSEKYTSTVLSYYGYPAGAVVLRVDDGSPAKEAGIARGDIITKFDGHDVTEYNVLAELLNDCDVGQTVDVEIYRAGNRFTVKLTIASNSK